MINLKKTNDKNNVMREAMELFYDKDFNIIGGMLPYPNSAVCFDSNILHTVKPLSRDCKVGRKALVFQLEEI
jgi:hypothetical protein